MTSYAPKLPYPEAVALNAKKTALLVLDITELFCADHKETCSRLVPGITKLLDKARSASVFIAYTVSAALKGKPMGQVYSGFDRRLSEPVIYPDAFDKFASNELHSLLELHNIDTLIITGHRSNIAVLHTATKAARELHYRVIIPIDGIAALTDYEKEYTLFHFTVLPGGAAQRFTFTTLDMITFQ